MLNSIRFILVIDQTFSSAELLLYGSAQMTELFSAEHRTFFTATFHTFVLLNDSHVRSFLFLIFFWLKCYLSSCYSSCSKGFLRAWTQQLYHSFCPKKCNEGLLKPILSSSNWKIYFEGFFNSNFAIAKKVESNENEAALKVTNLTDSLDQ